MISIHALRVEGDLRITAPLSVKYVYFYPRPPGGGRRGCNYCNPETIHFYPRPPGGGRLSGRKPQLRLWYFYPRPPGGGRLLEVLRVEPALGISIHALRVEGDFFVHRQQEDNVISIHALRVEGDHAEVILDLAFEISIHALRVEGDLTLCFVGLR